MSSDDKENDKNAERTTSSHKSRGDFRNQKKHHDQTRQVPRAKSADEAVPMLVYLLNSSPDHPLPRN